MRFKVDLKKGWWQEVFHDKCQKVCNLWYDAWALALVSWTSQFSGLRMRLSWKSCRHVIDMLFCWSNVEYQNQNKCLQHRAICYSVPGVCGMLWSQIMSWHGLMTKNVFGENIFLKNFWYCKYSQTICKIDGTKYHVKTVFVNITYFKSKLPCSMFIYNFWCYYLILNVLTCLWQRH